MKCIYSMTRKGEKAVLDIQAVNNYIIGLLCVFFFVLAGCSATKTEAVKRIDEKKDIDYTRYDLVFVEGVKQKLDGKLAEAIYKFDEAIRINPESDAAHYQISQVAAMRSDYDNALKYGRRALELDYSNTWYHTNMAEIYIQLSSLDSAARYLENLVVMDPGKEAVEFQLANIYMQTGNTLKGERIFEKFYKKYGAGEDILIALLNARVTNGNYGEAKQMILEELSDDPQSIQLNGLLAEIYRKTGEKDKAAEVYQKMMDGEDDNSIMEFSYLEFLIEEGEYTRLFEMARKVISREEAGLENKVNIIMRMLNDSVIVNNYAESIIDMGEDMLANDRDDPTIALMMAEIYADTGYDQKEIETLIEFVQRNEGIYYIWENLLLKLNERENKELLYEYAQKASALFNRAPLPKILYAYSLIEKGKGKEAGEELQKVRMLVNGEKRFMVQILSMEAEIAYRDGDMAKASEKFDEALSMEPENPLVLNNYAYYLAEENIRLDEAEEMIEKCLGMEENITYLDTHAWILYKKGKYRDAERIMSRIFGSARITDSELLEHYGFIKKAVGKCSDAVVLWQAALKEDRTKSYLIEEINKCLEEK